MKMDPPPSTPGEPAGAGMRDDKDVKLLCALAAAHTLFGRHDTAAGFVGLAAWIMPENRRVIELQALIDMRRGRLVNALDATTRLRAGGHAIPDELTLIETRAAAQQLV
ncbi:hypothetical protein [uncultured Tateyamaria sp.]|uniref:hypothetical protein n=1 Tax=uncultured Tateyamaria sp. TaxID=455651 RepID=UPI00260F61A6|nr:hypothetical protein [uncultured Tateyamaria sp.]